MQAIPSYDFRCNNGYIDILASAEISAIQALGNGNGLLLEIAVFELSLFRGILTRQGLYASRFSQFGDRELVRPGITYLTIFSSSLSRGSTCKLLSYIS